jgi:hypothetical protein
MTQEHKLYFSERGLPLITVENYCKWYSMYLLHPDGTVAKVPAELENNDLFCDHVWHPSSFVKTAKEHGWLYDEKAMEMIGGRWQHEIQEEKWSDEYDPEAEEIAKALEPAIVVEVGLIPNDTLRSFSSFVNNRLKRGMTYGEFSSPRTNDTARRMRIDEQKVSHRIVSHEIKAITSEGIDVVLKVVPAGIYGSSLEKLLADGHATFGIRKLGVNIVTWDLVSTVELQGQ